jgi:hypothetical protein
MNMTNLFITVDNKLFDKILESPPYCTSERNSRQSSKFALSLLSCSPKIAALRCAKIRLFCYTLIQSLYAKSLDVYFLQISAYMPKSSTIHL